MNAPLLPRRAVLGAAGLTAFGLVSLRAARASADPSGAADAAELDAALAEVARARASLKSLVGPFTQERTIALMATKIRSTGTLTLLRPDRLRWELAAPDSVTYWVGPEGFAYRGGRGQGKVPASASSGPNGKLAAAMDDIRILLGGDLARLKDRYALRLTARSAEGLTFEADPKPGAAGRLTKITFSLDRERLRPTKATLVEGSRDRTDIVFGRLERDTPIDAAALKPPF